MNKIKERKKAGATCPVCKSPDYIYKGRAGVTQFSKHQFECNSFDTPTVKTSGILGLVE